MARLFLWRGLIVAGVWSLAACAGLGPTATPAPSPTAAPTPAPTAAELPPPAATATLAGADMSGCYLFIGEYAESLGGLPAAMQLTYLSSDGLAQHTAEMSDDTLQTGQTAPAEVNDLFGALAGLDRVPFTVAAVISATPSAIVSEGSGPTLMFETGGCAEPGFSWRGAPGSLPPAGQALLAQVRARVSALPAWPLAAGALYIRSQVLAPAGAQQARQAQLVHEVTASQLAGLPLLEAAMLHPRRLVAVPSAAGLYGGLPLAFTPGKSAHLGYQSQVFQIRHLVVRLP